MREIQTYGRYTLYVILFMVLIIEVDDQLALAAALTVLIFGVPGYWFWTRARHRRDHRTRSVDSCTHCRERFALQSVHEDRAAREAAMNHVNRKYQD